MGLSNGILTAPFTKIGSNGDLQQALNRAVTSHIQLIGDVDSNGNALNPSKINKWAKHKPFVPLTATVLYADNAARDSAALAVDWGLTIPVFSTVANFLAGWQTEWAHTKPTSNYRALDFDRYATDDYLVAKTGLNRNDPKITTNNFMRFPMGGALMVPDAAHIANGSNSFPMWINQHESDGYILAPSDFAGATGNNAVVNGTRVDISKMYLGLAAIYNGSLSNPTNYVWIGDTPLTSLTQIGYYPSDLTVVNTGNYYLVPILADAHTNNAWTNLASTNASYFCSIDGYAMSVTIVTSVTEFVVKAGYSESYSTASAAQFNFYFKNSLAAGMLIEELRCYIIAEATYQNSTYASDFQDLKDDMEVGQDPMANVTSGGKIIARYFNIISNLQSTTINTSGTASFRINTNVAEDGLSNPYNVLSCVLLFVKYKSPTNSVTSTMEVHELYYRNGNIITD